MPTSRPKTAQQRLGEILELHSDIEELKDEMEEWRDNLPDALGDLENVEFPTMFG